MLVVAQALVNGLSVRRTGAPAPFFTYYNIETDAHEVILANGAPVETFCDNIGREAFDNHARIRRALPLRAARSRRWACRMRRPPARSRAALAPGWRRAPWPWPEACPARRDAAALA
jgi:hypothetical protein